jgi:hypothetical protein
MVNDFLTFPQRLIVRPMQKAIGNEPLAGEGKRLQPIENGQNTAIKYSPPVGGAG